MRRNTYQEGSKGHLKDGFLNILLYTKNDKVWSV